MNKDNQTVNRLPLSNNWDSLESINSNDCTRKSFARDHDDVVPKPPDITTSLGPILISKEKYESICRHAINDHECGYYQQIGIDPISNEDWPKDSRPIIKIPPPSPPPPPPGPLKRQFASERIPSETFGQELIRTTKENHTKIEKEKEYKNKIFAEKVENRYNELMEFLTDKYYEQVVSCLKYNAGNGKHQAFMNFKYEDFKANMPTLGKPKEIQKKWIEEMKNPNSIFLKEKRPLEGISYDCWGNGSFTVHFKW